MGSDQAIPNGRRVAKLAKALSPAQLAELLAVKELEAIEVESPILSGYRRDPDIGPLIRRKLLEFLPPPEPWGRKWRLPKITKLGERVLLCRIRDHLEEAGLLPDYRDEDDA